MAGLFERGIETLKTDGARVFVRKTIRHFLRPDPYQRWIAENETDLTGVEPLSYEPLISIVVPVYNVKRKFLTECIASVLAQTYENWELLLVDDHSTMPEVFEVLKDYEIHTKIRVIYREENGHISRCTNTGIENATGEFVGLLDCDDLLSPNALYEVARLLNEKSNLDFIYSDEDHIKENGRRRKDVFFKPDWSPDTFMSLMYTCHFAVFRLSLVRELGGMRTGYEGSQDYDLVLRVSEQLDGKRIGHVPKVLYHWRERKGSTADSLSAKPYIREATQKAKEDALNRRGLTGHLEWSELTGQYRVVYAPRNDAFVSIVIPSKDNPEMLFRCIRGILAHTDDVRFELIVVDNGSGNENRAVIKREAEKLSFCYVYRPMTFNFSAMCNLGRRAANGDFLLFLNDDIEIREDDWLSRMTGHAGVPYVGAVGCKLHYPDGNLIQHAGVLNLPIGPGHAFHKMKDEGILHYGRNVLEYNFTAVTGACLLVETKKFDAVGGFDETLPVAYNDVELCFKFLEKGLYNVLRTDVTLIHYESVSRGEDEMDEEKRKRQLAEMEHLYELHPAMRGIDKCYNPNLTQDKGDFSLRLQKEF